MGVDGLLTLDLPPEGLIIIGSFEGACDENIFIVAPTTPKSRIPVITKAASGFHLLCFPEGVTGERDDLAIWSTGGRFRGCSYCCSRI